MTSIVGCADTFPERGKARGGNAVFFYKLRKIFDFIWFFTASFSLNDERCG